MANLDSADLLARCKRLSGVPSTTEFPADTDWYNFLSDAQVKWTATIASIAPHHMYGAPTLLTSADGGYTYPFVVEPIGQVEIYESKTGRLLRQGPYWDPNADYVWEGDLIRIPDGKTKSWGDGPYARYVSAPTVIAAATEPTLLPKAVRVLLVPEACGIWATRGGMRDPRPFFEMANRIWYGNPAMGDHGILGMLKGETAFGGSEAYAAGGEISGLEFIDTGSGYSSI